MFSLDLKTKAALKNFSEGKEVDGMFFVNARNDRKGPLVLDLECECLSSVIESDYGQSLLCTIANEDALKMFEEIEDRASDMVADIDNATYKHFIQDEKFFLKLAIKNDKYKARITPAANPTQLDKSPFYAGANLRIELTPNLYIRFDKTEDKTECATGLYLTVKKITIDGGRKKKSK